MQRSAIFAWSFIKHRFRESVDSFGLLLPYVVVASSPFSNFEILPCPHLAASGLRASPFEVAGTSMRKRLCAR